MKTFHSAQEILDAVGQELGVSDWVTVDQQRIDTFADATGDHQWIHVDPERAAAGPFGTTIAHGYLTLSLVPVLVQQTFSIENAAMSVNYGSDKVRFIAPVPVDSELRDRAVLSAASEVPGGVQFTITHTLEIEGSAKPACVAQTITRVIFTPA